MAVTPYVLACVVCDAIHMDPGTHKRTILGVFSQIFATTLPATIQRIAVYLALTDGHGTMPLNIKLVDSEEERDPVFEATAEADFPDPRAVGEITLTFHGVTFPAFGEYRLQIFAGNEFLIERRIVVVSPSEVGHAE